MICPCCGKPKKIDGLGTALKPAMELIAIARNPLSEASISANVLAHSTGALNIDGCRVEGGSDYGRSAANARGTVNAHNGFDGKAFQIAERDGDYASNLGRWPANVLHDSSLEVLECFAAEDRPAIRFFYSPKASAEERPTHLESLEISWGNAGQKALLLVDTDQCQPRVIEGFGIPSSCATEWNTWLFGSGLTALCRQAVKCTISTKTNSTTQSITWNSLIRSLTSASIQVASFETANGGSHAASADQSAQSLTIIAGETAYLPGANLVRSQTPFTISAKGRLPGHPTVKPTDLMAWLVRLITPPRGTVLDPFCGSGSTGIAALRQGFRFIGIESDPFYFEIACARIRAAYDKPDLFTSQPKEKPIQEALSFEGAV